MREFVTAVEQETKTPDQIESGDTFPLTRTTVNPETGETEVLSTFDIRYYRPSDGQFAVLMAGTGRHASNGETIGTVLNFFESVLDDDSAKHIRGRLLDREDEFGLKEVKAIMEDMIEEWGGRPTKRPSASSASLKTDGQNSTPTTRASILSGSRLIDS